MAMMRALQLMATRRNATRLGRSAFAAADGLSMKAPLLASPPMTASQSGYTFSRSRSMSSFFASPALRRSIRSWLGQQLFRKLQLNVKDLKEAIKAVLGNQRVTDQKSEGKYEALDKYGNDLTELARRGKLDPVIGRDDEIRRCIQILSRRTKNNPVIIGEPGVGKIAIAEGLAQRIVRGDVPEPLLNRKLISLDTGSLVAGAKF
ncbi:hypothetical protein SAY86_002725 [Trapa natans]|uniref:Uncharacterized protein n=1 Tax=Trapa natans TaxID=22666 RepID=A0AAN7LU82_TRANT|nr:hypothetical protein SAY86_002725 [Trapa natans]